MQLRDFKHDVFISYSRKDYVREDKSVISGSPVDLVIKALEDNGISYWIDRDGIYTGDEFQEVICTAIEEARIFLFISSVHSNDSHWTPGEVATAVDLGMDIIPFKIDDALFNKKIRIRLAPLDRIEVSKMGKQAYPQLIKSIKQHIDKIKAEEAKRDAQKRGEKERQEKYQKSLIEISIIEENIKAHQNKRKALIDEIASLGFPVDNLFGTPKSQSCDSSKVEAIQKELAECQHKLKTASCKLIEAKNESKKLADETIELKRQLEDAKKSLADRGNIIIELTKENDRLKKALEGQQSPPRVSESKSQVVSAPKVIGKIEILDMFGDHKIKSYPVYDHKCCYSQYSSQPESGELYCEIDYPIKFTLEPDSIFGGSSIEVSWIYKGSKKSDILSHQEGVYIHDHYRVKFFRL